jgi:transposase-like protein
MKNAKSAPIVTDGSNGGGQRLSSGRLILVGRITAHPRRPIGHIAHEMGVSRTTAYRWWGRYQQLGQAGLVERPSVPQPQADLRRLEQRILMLPRGPSPDGRLTAIATATPADRGGPQRAKAPETSKSETPTDGPEL